MSNFVRVVQKRLGMNKFGRTKSPTGSKFSKIFFQCLYTGWTVVVHLYCGFSLWHQMAPQHSAKFRTAFFGQFRTSLRKDSVANLDAVFDICYRTRCTLQGTKHFADPSVGGAIRFANCGRDFAKRKQSDAEFAGNTTHGYY